MANLTKEQREQLPPDDFGDPEGRLFPITDQEDVNNAAKTLGPDDVDMKSRIKKIAYKKGLQVPAEWQDGNDQPNGGQPGGNPGNMRMEGGQPEEIPMSVEFSLSPESTPGSNHHFVRRPAPVIFRAGTYPDKFFSITPEELRRAVKNFRPVDLDLEHKPTVLNGRLGRLSTVQLSKDGWTIGGAAEIPKWLDETLPPDERRLSVVFDRKTKNIIGCSLVRNPRVSDARLMAAFARFDANTGGNVQQNQNRLQKIHDMTAEFGSECDSEETEEEMAEKMYKSLYKSAKMEGLSDDEAAARAKEGTEENTDSMEQMEQQMYKYMYKAATLAGLPPEIAKVKAEEAKKDMRMARMSMFSKNEEQVSLQRIHNIASQKGMHCMVFKARQLYKSAQEGGPTYPQQRDDGGINDSTRLNESGQVKIKDKHPKPLQTYENPTDVGGMPSTSGIVQGQEGKGAPDMYGPGAAKGENKDLAFSDERERLQAELAAEKRRANAERAARISAEAVVFADNEIGAERSMPNERDALIAEYIQCATDDANTGTAVVFSGQQMTRVQALQCRHRQRLQHTIVKELLPVGAQNTAVLNTAHGQQPNVQFNSDGTQSLPTMNPERRKHLLNLTSTGRMVLKELAK